MLAETDYIIEKHVVINENKMWCILFSLKFDFYIQIATGFFYGGRRITGTTGIAYFTRCSFEVP